MITVQQQAMHQMLQSPRLQQQTQSPGSQPPPQSPRSHQVQSLPQSPRSHQLQPLSQSPQLQHPSQSPQSQPPHINSHVINSSMEIDSVQTTLSTIVPKPITDGISSTSLSGMHRQITPIAPANQSGLPSPLQQNLSVANKLQLSGLSGVKMHTIPSLGMNLPETPASLALAEPEEMDKHPLSKRKIQQLVDQIDPKERLEPEVEDVRYLFPFYYNK